MFALTARFDLIDSGAARNFDELVDRTCAAIEANEPATLQYAVYDIAGSPLSRVFVEVYEDRAAFDAHENMPYVHKFLAERERYVKETRVEWLIPRRSVRRAEMTSQLAR